MNDSSRFSSFEFLVYTNPSQIFFLPSIPEAGEGCVQISFSPGQCVHRCQQEIGLTVDDQSQDEKA